MDKNKLKGFFSDVHRSVVNSTYILSTLSLRAAVAGILLCLRRTDQFPFLPKHFIARLFFLYTQIDLFVRDMLKQTRVFDFCVYLSLSNRGLYYLSKL